MSLYAHGLVHSWPTLPLRLMGLAHILAEHHNAETGECFPAVSTLAHRGETSERSIQRALQELEERGVISRAPSFRDSGRQTANNYVFHAATNTSQGGDTSVTGGGDTSVTPMLIRNNESDSSLRDESVLTNAGVAPPAEEKKRKPNPCPYEEIRALWERMLPNASQPLPVENWTAQRKAQIRARWQNELPTLEHWERTLSYVQESPFLMGKTEPSNGRRPFRITLWWISKPENLSKLYEGVYDA